MIFEVQKIEKDFVLILKEDWKWNDDQGKIVTIKSIDSSKSKNENLIHFKLKQLLEGELIELRNPIIIAQGCLVCDVFIQGKNIIDILREG